jgi:hypothetical protein
VIELQSIESAHRTVQHRAQETENESVPSDERFLSLLNQYVEIDGQKGEHEPGAEKKVARKKEEQREPVEKQAEKKADSHTIKEGMVLSGKKNRVRLKVRTHLVVEGEKRRKAADSAQMGNDVTRARGTPSDTLNDFQSRKRVRNHFLLLRGEKVKIGPQGKAKQKDGNGGGEIFEAKQGTESQKQQGKVKLIAKEGAKAGIIRSEPSCAPRPRQTIFTQLLRGETDQSPSASGKDHTDAGSDFTVASERYEQSVPRLAVKQSTVLKSTDELFNEIVRQFSLTIKNGGGEARVVLQPEILGKIQMDLKLNDNRINSMFVVENQSIKDLIMSKLNVLENSLLQQGFSLGSFQVEVREKNMGLQASEQGLTRKNRSGYGGDDEQQTFIPVSSFTLPWISTIVNVTA